MRGLDIGSVPANLVSEFFAVATQHPKKVALVEPLQWNADEVTQERVWTYGQLHELIDSFRKNLDQEKIGVGHHVVVMVPVTVNLYALVASLLSCGAVPVFIDHTMPRVQFLKSLSLVKPRAIISTQALMRFRFGLPQFWGPKLYSIDSKGFLLKAWPPRSAEPLTEAPELASLGPEAAAIISFTSGSTGQPKAVDRNQSICYYQRSISNSLWCHDEGDVELTVFPLVVLNNLIAGTTTVLPPVNFSKLSQISARCWFSYVMKHSVNRLVAPPSVLHALVKNSCSDFAQARPIRSLLTGGAPTPKWLLELSRKRLGIEEGYVVYGSSEAEPISFTSFDEYMKTEGQGYLVGECIEHIDLKLLSPEYDAQSGLDQQWLEAKDQIGEVLISGPHVVKRYLFNEKENELTKLKDQAGTIWHRTGDLGYFDSQGKLWLCGRLNDRIEVEGLWISPYPLEHSVENALSSRAALVNGHLGGNTLYVEGKPRDFNLDAHLEKSPELKATLKLEWVEELPVDHRHFWKIDRNSVKRGNVKGI